MPEERLFCKFISKMLCPQDMNDVMFNLSLSLSLNTNSLVCITSYLTNTST